MSLEQFLCWSFFQRKVHSINVVAQVEGLVRPQSPSAENAVLKAAADKSAANLIRSHSIAGDLHGIHAPDPVAADILRKEPEQETYVKLNVSPIGTSSVPVNRMA